MRKEKIVASLRVLFIFGVLVGAWFGFRYGTVTAIKDDFQKAWGDCAEKKYATQLLTNAAVLATDDNGQKAYCVEAEAITNSVILFLTLTLLYWMLQTYKQRCNTYATYPSSHDAEKLKGWWAIARSAFLNFGPAARTYGPATAYYAVCGGLVLVNSLVVFPRLGFGAAIGVWVALLIVWQLLLKDRELPGAPGLSINTQTLQEFRKQADRTLYTPAQWKVLQTGECTERCAAEKEVVEAHQAFLTTLREKIPPPDTLRSDIIEKTAQLNGFHKQGLHRINDQAKELRRELKGKQREWRTLMRVLYEYNEYARAGTLQGRHTVHGGKGLLGAWNALKHKVWSIPDEDGAVAYRNLAGIFGLLTIIVFFGSHMKPGRVLYGCLGLMVVFFVLYGKNKIGNHSQHKIIKALRRELQKSLPDPLKHVISSDDWKGGVGRAYRRASPLWVNGAWLNYWRLVIVSSAFHFIALSMSAHTNVPAFTPCAPPAPTVSPSKFSSKELSNADQCATYIVLEQLNMMGSLVCTFILFALLMAGGYVSKIREGKVGAFCRETIGTEDVRISGEWWNIVAHPQTWRALGLYIAVFALLGHLTAVGYVYKQQGELLRDTSVYRSFAFTGMKPDRAAGEAKKSTPPPSTAAEQQKTIIQYAMYNDIFNNFIMIVLLLFLVPYVKEKFYTTDMAAKEFSKAKVVPL